MLRSRVVTAVAVVGIWAGCQPGDEELDQQQPDDLDVAESANGAVDQGFPWYECAPGWEAYAYKPGDTPYNTLAIGTTAYTQVSTSQGREQAVNEVQNECRRLYGEDCCCLYWKQDVPWFGYRVSWFALGMKCISPDTVNPTIWRDGVAGNPDLVPGSVISIYGADFAAEGNLVHFLQNGGDQAVGAGSYAWYESAGQINVQVPPGVYQGWASVYVETPAGDSNLEIFELR